jgi:hypothetical protein
MRHPDRSELARIAMRPAVAFATAALERALPSAKGTPDVEETLRAMLSELWAAEGTEPCAHAGAMSEAQAMALPSARFYFAYQARLLELIASSHHRSRELHALLGAAIALISFIVWVLHLHELSLCPGKPSVLGNDIAEVGWETLEAGLATLIDATSDPDGALTWQREQVARLVVDYPTASDPDELGPPLGRDYFFTDRPNPGLGEDRGGKHPVPSADIPPLEERFTYYGAIALATLAMQHAAAAPPSADGAGAVQSLVEALWAWQEAPHSSGRRKMSKDEARTLASFRFYAELPKITALRESADEPRERALMSGVVDALTFIVWMMDGVERLLNWGKPTVVGDEIGDDGWDGLVKALDGLAASAPDADAERTWQVDLIERVAKHHPGTGGVEVLGCPVKREELASR